MLIKSSHSNCYVYNEGMILLVHPLLLDASKVNCSKGLSQSPTSLYYVRKYSFLKKCGYLTSKNQKMDMTYPFLSKEKVVNQLQKLKAISIEITEKCNMKCEYCGYSNVYEQYGDMREGTFIKEYAIYALIDELYQYWKEEAAKEIEISFYGGEPLLGMSQIKNIISHIENNYPQVHFIYKMTTNGLLLLKNMPYMIEHDIKVSVSLDGTEQHNAYRKLRNGQDSHKQIVQILDTIKNTFPKYYEKNIHISAVLHHLNSINGIQEYVKNRLNLFPYIGSLNTNNIKDLKKFTEMYRSKDEMFSVISYQGNIINQHRPNEKHLKHFLCTVLHRSFRTIVDLLQQDVYISFPAQKTCLPFNKELFLTVKGEIFPCESIARTYPLGNISEGNSVNLSPAYIADLYNRKIEQQQRYCSRCFILPFCFHCLFQILPTTEKEQKCPQYLTQEGFEKYIREYIDYLEEYPSEYSKFCIH